MADREVARVVMESTGVYWKPVVRHEALFDRWDERAHSRACRSRPLKLRAA